MAERLSNTMYKNGYEAYSAGISKTSVNPYTIEVMKEIGIDLSKYYSKTIEVNIDKKYKYSMFISFYENSSYI